MSRTTRCLLGDRWWFRQFGYPWHCDCYGRPTLLPPCPLHRDGVNNTPTKANTKHATKRKRRAAWRIARSHIIGGDYDHDVVNREKLYLGEIWNWD